MGTYDLKAGIITTDLTDLKATFAAGNAPGLILGQTLILLPCGSKVGWLDDQQHEQALALIEQLGGRAVTVESEVGVHTVEQPSPETATWLSLNFVDEDTEVTDPEHEIIISLPINDFRLRLHLSDTYPVKRTTKGWVQDCVVQLPAGLRLRDATWFGPQGKHNH